LGGAAARALSLRARAERPGRGEDDERNGSNEADWLGRTHAPAPLGMNFMWAENTCRPNGLSLFDVEYSEFYGT
jgi:hypothetical protein